MDINQISIKNNQIKTVDIEKSNSLTPEEPSAISFRQILADCKAGSNGESDSAAQEQTESSVSQEDPKMLKEDDWQALESMLSTLFATLQQGQTVPVPEPNSPTENTYGAESLPISSSLQQFDEKLKQNPTQFTNEISSVLVKFLEGQPLTKEQSQLISQIGEVLMKSQEKKLPAENTYRAESLPISNGLQQFDKKLKQNPVLFTNEISSVLVKFLEGQPLTKGQSQLISQIGEVLMKSQEKKLPAENTYRAESLPISNSLQQFDEKSKQNPVLFTNEISSVLAKFLEGQPLTKEQSQLISQIGDVLMKSQENQESQTNQVIGEVPQQIIDKLKEVWGTQVEQKDRSEPLLPLSLDKNQILQSSIPRVVRIGSLSTVRNASSGEEDVNKTLETSAVLNPQSVPIAQNLMQDKPPVSPLLVSKFVPEVNEWMDRFMKVTNGQSGNTEAVLSLFPEHLGEIEIKISSQQGQVSAQILTNTRSAKEVLEGQLQNLHQALQQQGLQVQKLDIIQQVSSANLNQTNLSFSQSGSGYQQGQQRPFNRDGDAAKPQREKEAEGEVLPVTYGRASLRSASNIDFTA